MKQRKNKAGGNSQVSNKNKKERNNKGKRFKKFDSLIEKELKLGNVEDNIDYAINNSPENLENETQLEMKYFFECLFKRLENIH